MHRPVGGFGRRGHAHLKSQLTRAAEGIPATIVEGCGAATKREVARYLDMAIKSANETEHHLLNARDLGLISEPEWARHSTEVVEIRKMTSAYRKKVIASADAEQG